jgi:hypothetical protein
MDARAKAASLALSVAADAAPQPPVMVEETVLPHQDSWQESHSLDAARREDEHGNSKNDATTMSELVVDGSSKQAGRESAGEPDTTVADGVIAAEAGPEPNPPHESSKSIAETLCSSPTTETITLMRTQSSPTLAPESALSMPPLRRTHSGDAAAPLERDPLLEMETEPLPPRPACDSDASSNASHDSEGGASVASVAPTPLPPASASPAPTVKANSYKAARRDAPLRIFFPTEDLAMRAILSPPTLRGGAAVSTNTTSTTSTSTATAQQADTKSSLAESFLETTSRLFFQRGNSTTAATTTAAPAKDANGEPTSIAAPPLSRASTTSIAQDDLSRPAHSVVAASPNLPPPPFANMFTCESCHDDIGSLLSQGRHHCRNCGGSFCAACSSKTAIVPFQLYLSKGELRVCDGCFNRIRDFHAQAQTTQITWSGLPPPSSDQLTREFHLPPHEAPVTVFNCSYFVDFAPFYGHLFLTREHVCFRGYKTHKIKIAFADLHSLVKPEFYYINALQINTKSSKEKHFFAEFNGLRDLCFLRTDQLVRAFQEAKKKELAQPLSKEALKQQAIGRRRSYKVLAAAAGHGDLASFMAASGSLDVDDDDVDDESSEQLSSSVAFSEDHDEAMSITSSASDESAEPPLPPDAPLSKMAMILDCELRAEAQSVFELLWGNALGRDFLRDHMAMTKDIDIDIEDWQPITSENQAETSRGFAISKEDGYTMFRNVRSQHPPKTKFPGLPAYAGCCRLQRLRIEKSVDGSKWTRFVVSDLLRMSGIPFSDYFEIETRWVFTRDSKHYCHVQAGQIVNFLKSTWFKSQIESSSRSESKEGIDLWAKNAIVYLQDHAPGRTAPAAGSLPASPSPSCSVALDETANSTTTRRRSSGSSERSHGSVQKLSPSNVPMTVVSTPSSLDNLNSLVANPQSLIQVLTLVVLLYCVVVIRHQQVQLQRLSDTTSLLLARLQQQPGPSSTSSTSLASQTVCEQKLVDGAAAALQHFFHSQQHHH